MPLVEQELLTPLELTSSHRFSGVLIITFSVLFICFVCPFALFLLTSGLSVLLRFTNDDYHFGILQTLLNKPRINPDASDV